MLIRATTLAILSAISWSAWGQSQPARPAASQVAGEVKTLDLPASQISIRTDQGESVTVAITSATTFRKVPAGAQDLTKVTRIAPDDVGVGDRILAIGLRS